ncbi:MAG: hypothetical protein KDD03_13320 [Gelidibacter sp.]|nr:hypothetical protein [Gelidibacter sp.]
MSEELKKFIKNRALATFRVKDYIGAYSKQELADMIGMSRPTLDVRISKSNWRMHELENITTKLPELV